MISDAKKIPVDVVSKQFFSCHMVFFLFLQQEHFFLLHEIKSCSKENKSCSKEKKIEGQEKNCFVTLLRGIFLASEKNIFSECG